MNERELRQELANLRGRTFYMFMGMFLLLLLQANACLTLYSSNHSKIESLADSLNQCLEQKDSK